MVDTFEYGRDGWSIEDENITVTGIPLRKESLDSVSGTSDINLTTPEEYKEVLATMFARWKEEAMTKTAATSGTTRKAQEASLCEPPPAKKPMRNPIAWLEGLQARVDETSMCYAFAGQPTKRKFDVQKAKALGLPKGPIRGTSAWEGEHLNFRFCDSADCGRRNGDAARWPNVPSG